jgi:hypothetical protein
MWNFYKAIDSGFSLSHRKVFEEYIRLHSMIPKWMIFSDFCLGDKDKPNDAISYVFVPYVAEIEKLEALARKHLSQDFKHVKAQKIGLDFLNSKLFFSVTILLEKKRALLQATPSASREQMYEALIRNSLAIVKGKNSALEKKLRLMERKQNFKLMDNIIFCSFFAAYFANLLMQSLEKVEKIGWFPDRDNITTAFGEIIYDLVHRLFREFWKKPAEGILNFGKGEKKGAMWFDGLNRFPDYLAGTISDLNLTKLQCSGEKQALILKSVFAVNNFHTILSYKDRHFNSMQLTRKISPPPS